MPHIELLHRSALFSELDQAEIDALHRIVGFRELARGQVLFLEGDPAEGFFVLLSGSMRIYKSSAEGREFTLHRITPGQMFAEAAIFKGRVYPANCIATEDSVVAFFPKGAFVEVVKEQPTVALKIIGGLSAWLREFTVKLENLSLKDVPARLATYLLTQARANDSRQFELPVSKTELARELGTISETLSRTLKKLKNLGVIEESRDGIEILDPARLKMIAEGEKF